MRGETVKAVDGKAYKLIKNAGESNTGLASILTLPANNVYILVVVVIVAVVVGVFAECAVDVDC